MKVITTKGRLKDIAKSWRKQYPENSGDKFDIYQQLFSTPPKTPKRAKEIIGNSSWTDLNCNECGKNVDAVIEIGEEPDYESSTVYICMGCIKEALKLF